MEAKRAVIVPHISAPTIEAEHDTLPPSAERRISLDPDETAGLVALLYHAQQSLITSGPAIDAARDANDEELAEFFEDAQRESLGRVARAKILLSARLYAETHNTHGPHPLADRAQMHDTAQTDS